MMKYRHDQSPNETITARDPRVAGPGTMLYVDDRAVPVATAFNPHEGWYEHVVTELRRGANGVVRQRPVVRNRALVKERVYAPYVVRDAAGTVLFRSRP